MSSPAASTPFQSCRFGRFELQPKERRLLEAGRPVALGTRAFDLLVALAARRGQLVSKNDLLNLVWPNLVVEENNLQVQISMLRKLLGPQIIATIPGRGYRFTATVDGAAVGPPSAAWPDATPATKHIDAPPPRRTNLPADLPALYGRDVDLTSLRALLDAHALVTVVGAGGIGKSRLAQAMAHELTGSCPDGAWMVELAGLSDPALLPHAVAQVLDIKVARQRGALDQLVAGMAQMNVLVVLDNCEHLLDAATALAQAVLQGAPMVRLLATSQEPLRLPAEQQYRVLPLTLPPKSFASNQREFGAIALFEARVQAVNPHFSLTDDNLAVAIDICRRLDGLPLAIELAAARVATLGLGPVRDKLDARFKLLTGGSRATLRRHQTLRAALEWSHNLLDNAERAVFRRLGVFAGGFNMELAQAVAGDAELDEWAVLDHLSALVDKSLVVADAGEPPRYRLLESARAFALEQLAESETAAALRRHALAMRKFCESFDGPHLDGEMRTEELRALLLPERDNLRAAQAWATGEEGDVEVAAVLAASANALEEFAFESADWLVPLRQSVEDGAVSTAVTARYLRAMASINTASTGRVSRALQADAADRARTLYLSLAQPRRAFSSLVLLAGHRMVQGQNTAAQAAADEARELMQSDWPAMLRIRLLRMDGHIARGAGRLTEALTLYRDAVRVSASTHDSVLDMMARMGLADLLWETGAIEDAAREIRALVDDLRENPLSALDMAGPFTLAIGIFSEMDRIDEASAVARETLELMERGHGRDVEEWAYLFWRLGRFDAAAMLLGASTADRRRTGATLWPNQERLVGKVRAALQTTLGEVALGKRLDEGAALDHGAMLSLIAEALGQSSGSHG